MQLLHVVAGILWKNNQFLAAQRPHNKTYAGEWEFPGGKIESDETPEQALWRELGEEIGVYSGSAVFWYMQEFQTNHKHIYLSFFHVKNFTQQPQALENQKLLWITPQQALIMPFLKADQNAIQLLMQQTF